MLQKLCVKYKKKKPNACDKCGIETAANVRVSFIPMRVCVCVRVCVLVCECVVVSLHFLLQIQQVPHKKAEKKTGTFAKLFL